MGMSGVGKTFWSSRLASAGFMGYHCDDVIASRLQNNLGIPMKSVYDTGKWMGFPYEPGFAEREKQYLALEGEILSEMAETVHKLPVDQNVVIDTTGSAVYLDRNILRKLKESVLLVYLAITPEVHSQMLEEYIKNPRPLIWNRSFYKSPDESNESALRRSYSALIVYREALYEKFSDIKIEYDLHRQSGFRVTDFVELVRHAAQQMGNARRGLSPLHRPLDKRWLDTFTDK